MSYAGVNHDFNDGVWEPESGPNNGLADAVEYKAPYDWVTPDDYQANRRALVGKVAHRRDEVLAIPLASHRVPPKPPGDEHASPDGDDGDVEYRAAQQSSPRRGRRRACSRDAK